MQGLGQSQVEISHQNQHCQDFSCWSGVFACLKHARTEFGQCVLGEELGWQRFRDTEEIYRPPAAGVKQFGFSHGKQVPPGTPNSGSVFAFGLRSRPCLVPSRRLVQVFRRAIRCAHHSDVPSKGKASHGVPLKVCQGEAKQM